MAHRVWIVTRIEYEHEAVIAAEIIKVFSTHAGALKSLPKEQDLEGNEAYELTEAIVDHDNPPVTTVVIRVNDGIDVNLEEDEDEEEEEGNVNKGADNDYDDDDNDDNDDSFIVTD